MDTVKTFKKEVHRAFVKIERDDIKRIHSIILEILNDFISFCERNNLTYYLTGGSALGAVREHGIIPWDDDVDIMMPRKDYNILRETFENEFSSKYVIEAPGAKQISSLQFMKIRKKGTVLRGLMAMGPEYGIFIDIFPLDYAPDSKIRRQLCNIGYFILKSMHYSAAFCMLYDEVFRPYEKDCRFNLLVHMKIKRLWGKFLLSIKPLRKWLDDFDRRLQAVKPTKTYVSATDTLSYLEECFPIDSIYPPRKIQFDGLEVNIPNKSEEILKVMYGENYMTPPKNISYILDDFIAFDTGENKN